MVEFRLLGNWLLLMDTSIGDQANNQSISPDEDDLLSQLDYSGQAIQLPSWRNNQSVPWQLSFIIS